MSNINMNSIVKVNGGKSMNMVDFATQYGIDLTNIELIIQMASTLEKQGKLTVKDITTKEEDLIEKAVGQEAFHKVAEGIQEEHEEAKKAKREQKKEDCDLTSIAVPFDTTIDASRFEKWVNDLGVEDTEIKIVKGARTLIVRDITPNEFVKIQSKYNAQRAINATVNTADKAVNNITSGVNYLNSEVVAPVGKIACAGAMNLAKGIFHTGLKLAGSIVNSGAKAISDTKYELQTDEDLIMAQNQLLNAKESISRGVRKSLDKRSSNGGIQILD